MGSPPLPPKKDVALALLANSSVFVHLDPRAEGVVVPPWFRKQPQLVLQIGLNMAVPIPDLHLDDAGMSCTLSFNRAPFHCTVPWGSVYAMVDDEGRAMVWPDEVPPEIQAQVRARQESSRQDGAPAKKEPGAKRPRLEGVKADGTTPKRKKGEGRPARIAPMRAADESKDGPRLADVSADAPRAEVPVLAAGPRPVPASAPGPAVAGGKSPAGNGSPGGSGARKPKRELPPYLRVVK